MKNKNQQIMKKVFLTWTDPQIKKLKKYSDSKPFLCGRDAFDWCLNRQG